MSCRRSEERVVDKECSSLKDRMQVVDKDPISNKRAKIATLSRTGFPLETKMEALEALVVLVALVALVVQVVQVALVALVARTHFKMKAGCDKAWNQSMIRMRRKGMIEERR